MALSYINKMGVIRVDSLGKLARKIWQWAKSKKIILLASYIPSKENVVEDKLSRIPNNDTVWQLNDLYFQQIIRKLLNAKSLFFGNRITELFVLTRLQSHGQIGTFTRSLLLL